MLCQVSMDGNSDTSMLSDELKPRRTPVPALFSDMLPRPSVPDLSIIETPQSTAPAPALPPVSVQPPTVVNHLSYNDWRSKTGNAPYSGLASCNNSPQSGGPASQSPRMPSSSTSKDNGYSRHVTRLSKETVNENRYNKPSQTASQIVTYTNFQKRPTSAPAVRTQQFESESARDHPLSKSAPPTRPSNPCTQLPSRDDFINPTSEQIGLINRGHVSNGCVNVVNPHAHYHTLRPQPNVMNVPHSVSNQQNVNSHAIRSLNTDKVHQSNGQMSDLMIPCKDVIKNTNDPLAINDVSCQSNHVHLQERNYSAHPTEYHPLRKSVGPWSYHEQGCCLPPVSCHGPHHVHPIHSSPYPQVSYDELYKIVLAQNDQLKALQAQVERLLVSQNQHQTQAPSKEVEAVKLPVVKTNAGKMAVAEEGTQTSDSEYVDDDCQKMSIGVMTSFVQTVTYRGRVGRANVSEHEGSQAKNSNFSKSSSDDSSATSMSSGSKTSSDKDRKCCKECSSKDSHADMMRNRSSKIEKRRQASADVIEEPKKAQKTKRVCPEGCTCDNPGVSAAISAVRGCQAALAGMTPNEYSTFNGADLPTVTEQPVSPMSSIHVDLHDYRSSSSDADSGSSHSDGESSEENTADKDHVTGDKPVGWTFYNNVLGQVNKILEERDVGGSPPISSKQTDLSVSKRVAFEATGAKSEQNLKEMALRYLKENHPEVLASSVETTKKSKRIRGEKGKEKGGYNMPASNMSFATFRYLERYNLLPENFNPQQYLEEAANIQGYPGNSHEPRHSSVPHRGSRKPSRMPSGKMKSRSNFPLIEPSNDKNCQLQTVDKCNPKVRDNPNPVHYTSSRKNPHGTIATSKILDITTLRQQPKLL